jgi:hypothetical protein
LGVCILCKNSTKEIFFAIHFMIFSLKQLHRAAWIIWKALPVDSQKSLASCGSIPKNWHSTFVKNMIFTKFCIWCRVLQLIYLPTLVHLGVQLNTILQYCIKLDTYTVDYR